MRKILIIIIAITYSDITFGQEIKGITPMHNFLQKNADTTIIFEYEYSVIHTPEYKILSKKGDTINLYSYGTLFDKKINMPSILKGKLFINSWDIMKIPVDINVYFNVKQVSIKRAKEFWNNITLLHTWQIPDDNIDGEGCAIKDVKVYDGVGIVLYLITKNEIKRLYFYEPQYFEKKACPGRKGRQAILKIENLFSTYFKE